MGTYFNPGNESFASDIGGEIYIKENSGKKHTCIIENVSCV